ncbi:hypothetical protein [Gordonia sp. i37]|uniref:hypothetical protein n=1 Tax=Gordonia sp. i37 TaxID=1961707 RepID=UPI0009AD5B49|nr:hypothetical protein [Gordonia sp. i37]OPX14376.1 hypothetical protein B1964_15455 [Gordonia sp. i37]
MTEQLYAHYFVRNAREIAPESTTAHEVYVRVLDLAADHHARVLCDARVTHADAVGDHFDFLCLVRESDRLPHIQTQNHVTWSSTPPRDA